MTGRQPGRSARGDLLPLRVARTVFFVLWFAFALYWAIPRFVPRLVGDRVFLREEFFHPAIYTVGGLTIAGRTIGGTTVDCSGLERGPARIGANVLANPGLDGPCGWGFAPHLGGKAAADREASNGRCFRIDGEEYAFQVVRLGALTPLIDRGEATLLLGGRFRARDAARPVMLVETASDDEYSWTPLAGISLSGTERDDRWLSASLAAVELPRGTRALRVKLRGDGGGGAVQFDDLSAVVRRVFSVESRASP